MKVKFLFNTSYTSRYSHSDLDVSRSSMLRNIPFKCEICTDNKTSLIFAGDSNGSAIRKASSVSVVTNLYVRTAIDPIERHESNIERIPYLLTIFPERLKQQFCSNFK